MLKVMEDDAKKLAHRSAEFVRAAVPVSSMESMTPPLADSPIISNMLIPEVLQRPGINVQKISSKGKQSSIMFRIDPDKGRVWYHSSKLVIIPIESIKEIRTGQDCRYYREQFKLPDNYEPRWITIVNILDGAYKILHVVPNTAGDFDLCNTALRKLYAIRQGLMFGQVSEETREQVWKRQYWKVADKDGDQVLHFNEISQLSKILNINLATKDLKKMFQDADTHKHDYLNYSEFQMFVKVLKRRPELETIYGNLASTNGGKFDAPAFIKFMKQYQKSKLGDAELTDIFHKYSPSSADSPNEAPNVMSLDGFSSFLASPQNAAFSEQGQPIWQDMNAPLSEYFISSSHNTYLVGNQLVGVSTIEGYIRVLLHSCRSVELDIYDGESGEPVVYHGMTMTSKVNLRDICNAISKYAFQTTPYPILLSAEVHCGVQQQDKIVDIMTEIFGDTLIQASVEDRPKLEALPSPESLKNKILVKAKNQHVAQQLAAAQAARKASAQKSTETLTDSDLENEAEELLKEGLNDLKKQWKKFSGGDKFNDAKHKMSVRLPSLLVYTVGVKCQGIDPETIYAPEHIFSLSENSANRFMKSSYKDLVNHNKSHIVRIYPKGTRVNSSNYEPHRYWAAGCQLVAINWQTCDLGYTINKSMFQRNGRAGYVLKPEALRHLDKDLLSKRTKHFLDVVIISAQQLPLLQGWIGEEIFDRSSVDPFVKISLHIPDWSVAPFLPESAKAAGANYFPSSDGSATTVSSARTISFNTKVVKNNGFNPVWQEELCLPFDCVGDMMDLIFVKFVVRQEGKNKDDEPLGVYCVPLGSLEHGFRHLPLHDSQLSPHLFSTLFVQINIRDIN